MTHVRRHTVSSQRTERFGRFLPEDALSYSSATALLNKCLQQHSTRSTATTITLKLSRQLQTPTNVMKHPTNGDVSLRTFCRVATGNIEAWSNINEFNSTYDRRMSQSTTYSHNSRISATRTVDAPFRIKIKTNSADEGLGAVWNARSTTDAAGQRINARRKKTLYLHTLAPLYTSSFQMPSATSPQQCVVMNAHALKPSGDMSRTRLANSVERVPRGDVRNTSNSPRRDADSVTTAWTCSRYTTLFGVLRQPSLSRDISMWLFRAINLFTKHNTQVTCSIYLRVIHRQKWNTRSLRSCKQVKGYSFRNFFKFFFQEA